MTQTHKSSRPTFELYNPYNKLDVVDEKYIGDFDTIFTLSNGTRILFDELSHGIKQLKEHDKTQPLPEDEWINEFGRRLKKKIMLSKYDQNTLSDKLEINRSTLSHYVNGKSLPTVRIMRLLCILLDCTMDELTNFDYLL